MKKYALAAAAEEDVLGIAAFPKMGRNRTEMGSEIMSLPFHRYLIYYQEHENLVEIIRVLHSAREVDEDLFV